MSETTAPPQTASPAPSGTQASQPLALLDTVLEPFNHPGSPGVVVAVAQHGKLLYRRAVGMASIEMGVANRPRTRIRIASTSKHFTAMGIMLLVEDGLVGLDDKVQKHLPEMPDLGPQGVTVRHLLTHTSGWRGHDELWALAHGLTFTHPGPGMPAMARQTELNFVPGTQMMYSNGGYHMLARIIERVSGKSYNDFLKERFFIPLDMLDTESITTDLDVSPGLAQPYMPKPGGGWTRGLYPCELDGGGSLASTVDDLLRWVAHLRSDDKKVGKAESWNLLSAPTTLASGDKVEYGFGLARHLYRGVEIVHHAGAALGTTSQMLTVPAHGLDIVILANGAPVNPAGLAIGVVEALLAEHLKERAPRAQSANFPSLIGQRYYARETGSLLGFADVDMAGRHMLGMSLEGSMAIPMNHVGDRLWLGLQEISASDIALDASLIDPKSAPDVLAVTEGGQPRRFERIAGPAPEVSGFAPQVSGTFFSAAMDASATIATRNEQLVMRVQGRYGFVESVLTLVSEDVALLTSTDPVLAKLGKIVLSFDREAGRVVGLRMNTARSRNLRFVRQESNA